METQSSVVLFDTGGNGQILLTNMQALSIDPERIQALVLSHIHSDHTGGLDALLAVVSRPAVYLLPSFGKAYNQKVEQAAEGIEVTPGQMITEDMLTTGEIGGDIPEQALIVRTPPGLVIITGCAHPGIVQIIERAIGLTGEPVHLVLGGFHLSETSGPEMAAIIADFRRLGVQKVAPSHCTGDRAIRMFAAEYGEDFLRTGAGSVINIDIPDQ